MKVMATMERDLVESDASALSAPGPTRRWSPLLEELAGIGDVHGRILSLYMDLCWDDEQQRERTRIAVKDQERRLARELARIGRAEELTEAMVRLEYLAEDRINRWTTNGERGLAVFLDAASGVERHVSTWRALPTLLLADRVAVLRPLVAALPVGEAALGVAVDAQSTRVLEVGPGEPVPAFALESPVPRRQGGGGWAQLRVQHHRDEDIAHHLRTTAELLSRRFFEGGEAHRILVVARPDVAAALVRFLPPTPAARARVLDGLSPSASESELRRGLEAALERSQAEDRRALLERARTEAASRGRASVGAAAVVEAMNAARVDHLLLEERSCADALLCPDCGWIEPPPGAAGTTAPTRSTWDGGAASRVGSPCARCGWPLQLAELGESLLHAAITCGARMTTLRGEARTSGAEVAALLRY